MCFGMRSWRLRLEQAEVRGGHTSRNVEPDFRNHVVDKTRLNGVTWQQLADYVGMYAYSRLKPGTHHANAPTILNLPDASPEPPSP